MAIRIISEVSNDPLVPKELLIQTIETNRDRVRLMHTDRQKVICSVFEVVCDG